MYDDGDGEVICHGCYEVRAAAAHYGIEATILPGLAHMLMLEPGWEAVTGAIERWLKTLNGRG